MLKGSSVDHGESPARIYDGNIVEQQSNPGTLWPARNMSNPALWPDGVDSLEISNTILTPLCDAPLSADVYKRNNGTGIMVPFLIWWLVRFSGGRRSCGRPVASKGTIIFSGPQEALCVSSEHSGIGIRDPTNSIWNDGFP